MKVKQCNKCRSIFQASANEPMCPKCVEKMDRDCARVKGYLYYHPSAGIAEMAKETGVEEKYILTFLRENRLSLAEPTDELVCASCAKQIKKGMYCEQCLASIQKELDRIMPPAASVKEEANIVQKNKKRLNFTQPKQQRDK